MASSAIPDVNGFDLLGSLMEGGRLSLDRDRYLDRLWRDNPEVQALLAGAERIEDARAAFRHYLGGLEERTHHVDLEQLLARATMCDCIVALGNVIAKGNEVLTGTSALEPLWRLARGEGQALTHPVSPGFLLDTIAILRGASGRASIYDAEEPSIDVTAGSNAAERRSEALDRMALTIEGRLARFPSGLETEVVERRRANRDRILGVLGGDPACWADHRWHLARVIKDPDLLSRLLPLSPEQEAAVRMAVEHRLPFGITPYYLSLLDRDPSLGLDRSLRAQVIPAADYVEMMVAGRGEHGALDFMGELDTSPVDLITRRYPMVAILKPYNTCSQICVYCQRNWEIDECMAAGAMASEPALARAIEWLQEHRSVGEVLVTGGDPMVLPDGAIASLLDRLSAVEHLYRIRIGTRTPVVLPQRWTAELAALIARHHQPGRREVAVVTHFQHAYEVTPEAMAAVQRIRREGMSVYNQQVFTVENARRFELAKLRLVLRSIGVDPYYTFNMKGKEETRHLRVPIARLLQERKEEARLLPGLDRTDEPVFNLPRLGKNHLRLWQDHRLLTIRPDGRRVYSMHPWEKNLALVPPYLHVDTSIFDFLQTMASRGEDPRDYRTVFYYF